MRGEDGCGGFFVEGQFTDEGEDQGDICFGGGLGAACCFGRGGACLLDWVNCWWGRGGGEGIGPRKEGDIFVAR